MHSFAAIVVFAAALAAAAATEKLDWNGLHVTWNALGPVAYALGSGYYSMPLTKAAANKEGYVQAKEEDYVTVWCLTNDPRVCVLYDLQGSVAGLQVMFPQEDLKGNPYDWTQHSLFFADTLFGIPVAGGRLYIVDPDTLSSGGRSTVDEDDIGTGLWLKNGSSYYNVPLNASLLTADSWSKESCIPTMGVHYYYNVSSNLACQNFEPFFLLVDKTHGWIKGAGFQTFGKKSTEKRAWQEGVPKLAVKPTIPNAPDCLVDWTGKYGVLSVHMYFTKYPYLYLC